MQAGSPTSWPAMRRCDTTLWLLRDYPGLIYTNWRLLLWLLLPWVNDLNFLFLEKDWLDSWASWAWSSTTDFELFQHNFIIRVVQGDCAIFFRLNDISLEHWDLMHMQIAVDVVHRHWISWHADCFQVGTLSTIWTSFITRCLLFWLSLLVEWLWHVYLISLEIAHLLDSSDPIDIQLHALILTLIDKVAIIAPTCKPSSEILSLLFQVNFAAYRWLWTWPGSLFFNCFNLSFPLIAAFIDQAQWFWHLIISLIWRECFLVQAVDHGLFNGDDLRVIHYLRL